MSIRSIRKPVLAAGCVVALGGVCVFADDPYADYVKLSRTDDKNNSSWNAVGGWSDGREPHSDTNYYVSGTLYRIHNLTDTNRVWNGGQLVIAGVFYFVFNAAVGFVMGLVEKRHEERYRALLENIKNDEVFQKSEIKMWECRYCGHIHIGTKAPKVCPICGAAQASFEINKVNY